MKKKLEGELISIAHRVLKLKNKSETIILQQEAKNLYEQLTVLRFYEEHFETFKNEIPQHILEEKLATISSDKTLETTVDLATQKIVSDTNEDNNSQNFDQFTAQNPLVQEEILNQTAKNEPKIINEEKEAEQVYASAADIDKIVAEMALKKNVADEIPTLDDIILPKSKEPVQISFEELLGESYKEPQFVRVEDVLKETEQATTVVFDKKDELPQTQSANPKDNEEAFSLENSDKQTNKSVSLNDRLYKSISFGLNDKIAFEKKLFGGSTDDFNRVISQLNTFDSFEEASAFINDFVKPDYNNWEGLEEFETRFLEIIEKKFH
ncbi:MAG TPA: hypothetical protein DDZ41_02570 [Flavobacterium sp.]|nr:hypothetical protein [Flavobacterium sp.]